METEKKLETHNVCDLTARRVILKKLKERERERERERDKDREMKEGTQWNQA